MNTILEQILKALDKGVGFTGSILTIYDFITKQDDAHVRETFAAIRAQSKAAYDAYCEYRRYRKSDIGVPGEEDILGYWESCLKRDVLPGAADMVSCKIAEKEEAEILSAYLLEAWMEVPDFAEWLHGILICNKLDDLASSLRDFRKSIEGVPGLIKELKQQNLSDIAFLISPNRIVDAKCSCTDLDIKHYYMVDNRFMTMFKVISAGCDIPHEAALQKVEELTESVHPVILAGNGGLGKTSLMMHTAVQWASRGRIAIWLSLSGREVIMERRAAAFFSQLTASVSGGQRVLLCIDNPYEGKASFASLQNAWTDNGKIQLLMAERTNRLTSLADPNENYLRFWFEDARIVFLNGLKKTGQALDLKDYESWQFRETKERRKQILDKCTFFLVMEGIVREIDRRQIVQSILDRYGKPTVSLVELIYRALFALKKKASKPEEIKLDWEEWTDFIESEFGKGKSYTSKELYGVIAALSIFHTPMTISLFCKYFGLEEKKLKYYLEGKQAAYHSEPVILKDNTLQPKHDVIAELFFLFHEKTMSVNSLMADLLQCMDEDEVETLLSNMVVKREFRKGRQNFVGQIDYKAYMDVIYERMTKHSCNLSETGRAYLCLGYLWSGLQSGQHGDYDSLNDILQKIAPEIDDAPVIGVLYTEWGIFARKSGDYALAEEKYKAVINKFPDNLPPRTELGKLFSMQKGREKEAEEVLRAAMAKDAKHVQSRTELGKLLSGQGGREKEAEDIFRYVMRIKPKDIQSRTELGKLLSRQRREKEAEEVLREVIAIDPQNYMARTEMGILLKNGGQVREAERVLIEAIKVNAKHIQSRTVLAGIYEEQSRWTEAIKLYREVCKYNPGDSYGREGLERLKKYI